MKKQDMGWIILACVLIYGLFFSGCAHSAKQEIASAVVAVDAVGKATIDIMGVKCKMAAMECQADSKILKADDCTAWVKCDAQRTEVIKKVDTIYNALQSALALIVVGNDKWKDLQSAAMKAFENLMNDFKGENLSGVVGKYGDILKDLLGGKK